MASDKITLKPGHFSDYSISMHLLIKILDQLAQPLNWVAGLLLLGLLRGRTRPAAGQVFAGAALALLLGIGVQALPDIGLHWLESRYAEIPPHADLHGYHGVVVLGGGMEPAYIAAAHTQPVLNDAGERMSAAVALWREQPALQLLFTGGEGQNFAQGPSEAARARIFFDSQGVPAAALRYEDQSRNTYENARFSAQLSGVDKQQPWLLLTSAWHMPRAMAIFQHAGWNVAAYPVDFRTGLATHWHEYSIRIGAEHWYLLLHELLGILSYRLSGRL